MEFDEFTVPLVATEREKKRSTDKNEQV